MKRDELIAFLECMLSILRKKEEDSKFNEKSVVMLIEETLEKKHVVEEITKTALVRQGIKLPSERKLWEMLRNGKQEECNNGSN